ncbi:MAG: L-lactate dehydrogenase [Candidatus Anoxychlamydiales bacterium]|nr:L-lactate dehydrogenase [Candidatus Anoxychlamydiales bacterium]
MQPKQKKISIIGAGSVGSSYAFSLMMSGIAREVVIVDINKKKAFGEALDLSHVQSFISPVEISYGNYEDIKDSDIVVITAGLNQKVNQSRLDLVKDNTKIFKEIIPKIAKNAPNSILIVVTNPVDVLSYVAYKISDFPKEKVIGSGTVLDSSRLRSLLSNFYKIDARNIHANLIGEHGNTEFPVWSKANISGIPFDKCNLIKYKKEDLEKIFEEVKNSAAKIIEAKGSTCYGIAISLLKITKSILRDENSILPVSSFIDNYLDVNDVYLSVPALIGSQGVKGILKMDLSNDEINNFHLTAKTIKDVIKQIGF